MDHTRRTNLLAGAILSLLAVLALVGLLALTGLLA
jgi:hypothetical protein